MAVPDLPEIQSVKVAKVGPRDVIVLEAETPISQETAARIRDYVESVWPGRKAIVFEKSLRMTIARDADLDLRALRQKLVVLTMNIEHEYKLRPQTLTLLEEIKRDVDVALAAEAAFGKPEVKVGDRMLFSTALLQDIHEQPEHTSSLVQVVDVIEEADGSKKVIVQKVQR